MTGFLLLLATLGLVAHNAPPVLHTPAAVAAHARCDVDRIAYDVGQSITWGSL